MGESGMIGCFFYIYRRRRRCWREGIASGGVTSSLGLEIWSYLEPATCFTG